MVNPLSAGIKGIEPGVSILEVGMVQVSAEHSSLGPEHAKPRYR